MLSNFRPAYRFGGGGYEEVQGPVFGVLQYDPVRNAPEQTLRQLAGFHLIRDEQASVFFAKEPRFLRAGAAFLRSNLRERGVKGRLSGARKKGQT